MAEMTHRTPADATYNLKKDNLTAIGQVEQFFFREEVPYGMALARMALCATLLWTMVYRWQHARELYSTDGAIAQLSVTFGQGNYLPELSGTAVVALASLLVLALVTSIIGWKTRISLSLVLVLYGYFALLDGLSTMTKYSVIACHILLMLAISNCGDVWSVDNWLSNRNRRGIWPLQPKVLRRKSAVWPQMLIQLFIGIVYLGAAATKLHTAAYFTGDQLKFWMVTQVNNLHPLGDYLVLHPGLIVVMCYVAIIWEIMFVFLVFTKWGRPCVLFLGVTFHAATSVTLGLYIFPLVMFSGYLAYLRESDVQTLFQWSRYLRRRYAGVFNASAFDVSGWALPDLGGWRPAIAHYSLLLYVCTILITMSAGVQAENWLDPYGLKRPEGPYELKAISHAQAGRYFQQESQIREEDRVFSLRLGTATIAGIVIDPRTEFTQGDTVLAQVALAPPHGDVFLECVLCDGAGKLLHQEYFVTPRECDLVTFRLNMCGAVEAGDYEIIIKVNGREAQRRSFQLAAGACEVVK